MDHTTQKSWWYAGQLWVSIISVPMFFPRLMHKRIGPYRNRSMKYLLSSIILSLIDSNLLFVFCIVGSGVVLLFQLYTTHWVEKNVLTKLVCVSWVLALCAFVEREKIPGWPTWEYYIGTIQYMFCLDALLPILRNFNVETWKLKSTYKMKGIGSGVWFFETTCVSTLKFHSLWLWPPADFRISLKLKSQTMADPLKEVYAVSHDILLTTFWEKTKLDCPLS